MRAAVTAQAHLATTGRRRGVSSRVTREDGAKTVSPGQRLFSRLARVYSFAFNPPIPSLQPLTPRCLRTKTQKPCRLESGSPIGSRESRAGEGLKARSSLKVPTIRRSLKNSQSMYGICFYLVVLQVWKGTRKLGYRKYDISTVVVHGPQQFPPGILIICLSATIARLESSS